MNLANLPGSRRVIRISTVLVAMAMAALLLPLGTLQVSAAGYIVDPVTRYDVKLNPYAMCSDGINLWVTNWSASSVTKLNEFSGNFVGEYAVGSDPQGVCFDGQHIWVTSYGDLNVTELSAADGAYIRTISLAGRPYGTIYAGGFVWVAVSSNDTIVKINPADGTITAIYPVGPALPGVNHPYQPANLAFDGQNIWVANSFVNSAYKPSIVSKIRASDGAWQANYPVGNCPHGICWDGQSIWVANLGILNNKGTNHGSLMKLNPSTGAQTLYGGSDIFNPYTVCWDGTYIWVPNSQTNTLLQIDPVNVTRVNSFDIGSSPLGIVADGESVWVANNGASDISRLYQPVLDVSIAGGPGGTVGPAGIQYVYPGATATVSIAPNPHYHVASIANGPPSFSISGTSYSFQTEAPHYPMYVTFAIDTFPVVFNTQGGSPVPASETISYGQLASAPLPPTRAGYVFAGWYKEAACLNAWNFSSDTVTAAVTLYAKWLYIHTVTASVSGVGGTVSPASQPAVFGSSASIAITPDSNYQIAGITDNGQPAAITNPYVIQGVAADHAVVVTFIKGSSTTLGYSATFNLSGSADLFLTDPDGMSIGVNPTTHQLVYNIAGASLSGLGSQTETITLAGVKPGNYSVLVLSRLNTPAGAAFTLTCTVNGVTDTLALNMPVASVLSQGFLLQADANSLTPMLKAEKGNLIATLSGAKCGDKETDKKLDEAINEIQESLDPSLWVSQDHLAAKHGDQVFNHEAEATQKLKDIIKDKKSPAAVVAICQKVVDNIVQIDRQLAETAYQDTVPLPSSKKFAGELEQYAKEMAEAQADLARAYLEPDVDHFHNSVEHYRQAWKHAMAAIGVAT